LIEGGRIDLVEPIGHIAQLSVPPSLTFGVAALAWDAERNVSATTSRTRDRMWLTSNVFCICEGFLAHAGVTEGCLRNWDTS
jgi:hypothetical protein